MRFRVDFGCRLGIFLIWTFGLTVAAPAAEPQSPRIANVEILADQGWATNPDTIWYDDFDSSEPLAGRYLEYHSNGGEFVPITSESLGGSGQSMQVRWQVGEVDAGGLKKTFGRNPMEWGNTGVRSAENFREIYWRHYVKMQEGWTGQPSKLSRATSFSSSNWSQAMIAHIWNGSPTGLKTDPARGVNSDSQVVTTQYNDFDNLQWLGGKGAGSSTAQVFDTAECGRWACVEGHVKLNTFGQSDGVFELFIDGRLEVGRNDINWVYSWDDYGINAVFLENHWNSGSPVEQERYFDDFVISMSYIGLAASPLNPIVTKTVFRDPDSGDVQAAWQLQIASNLRGDDLVWDSGVVAGASLRVGVSADTGKFQGSLTGTDKLLENHLYALRVRQQDKSGQWSSWSDWNTSLQTGFAEK